ncbi:hypothetical protein MHZ92_14505 [Sporosarcina sp. ACRSL]|uniref:hypothetical protein n=1 Tax=Sporosarcina sp. ACRSL TaxID=2918215 RepID=UPI001EF74519|nr:hypothetical protein [Sporosarcina sp. ACRSL]MCG7345347.1 hypothetical protein [Sporosarcina sp. ACRSL]
MTINMQQLAQDFTDYLNEFHSYQQPYDDAMDAEVYEQSAAVLRMQSKWGYFDWSKKRPHFGPSSAARSERELYEKARKAPRDTRPPAPHQRRWTALGEAIGGMLQREILLAERHYPKFTGKPARYRFARTSEGAPMYEHFTKKMHEVTYDGEDFAIFGLGDGILEHVTEDGEIIRIGLEIKSRQTSYAETGPFRMKDVNPDHYLQTVCYSEMYGLDYFFVVYLNSSKKAWNMTDEERVKSPDFRVFGYEIGEDARNEVKAKFARVTKAAREGNAPKVDLDTWQFNDYKTQIARTITEEEFEELRTQAIRMQNSSLPDWKKRKFTEAVDYIAEIRNGKEAI